MRKIFKTFICLCVSMSLGFIMPNAHAYSLRQFDNVDGLSNSAVLSLHQDSRGFMYIGTCDGLNIYDGRNINPFSTQDGENALTGDVIESVISTNNGAFWVMTNYGLNHVTPDGRVSVYSQMMGILNMAIDEEGSLFIESKDGKICYIYECDIEHVVTLEGVSTSQVGGCIGLYVKNNQLLVFGKEGILRCNLKKESCYSIIDVKNIEHRQISDVYVHGENIYMVDKAGMLYLFDIENENVQPVADMWGYIQHRGVIKDVVRDLHGQLLVGFANGGVLRMTDNGDAKGNFIVEDLGVKGGVFCLLPDRYQDVVWIGSDGHGLYEYANDSYSLNSITYSDLGNVITHPIRSIYLDGENTLWLGTKGNGLLMIKDFDPWVRNRGGSYNQRLLTTSNSGLSDNSVYAIVPSRKGGVWLGHERGVDYASRDGKTISHVVADRNLKYVHDIYQSDDNTLWLASVGLGVIKARIEQGAGVPTLKVEKIYTIDNGVMSSNLFFSLHHSDEGNVWVGNRGFGLFEIDGDAILSVRFSEKYAKATVKDVFAMTGTKEDLWVGTGYGLINVGKNGERSWLRDRNFPNSTIHSLQTDDEGNIWVATNRGLVCVDAETGNYRTFSHSSGLDVLEFSDGAVYKSGSTLFFGGVNGLSVVRENVQAREGRNELANYSPSIQFTRLNIAGTDVRLKTRICEEKEESSLTLSPNENSFSVSYVVPDFMSSDNYTYLYRLDNDKEWVHVPSSGMVSFTSMPYGDYVFEMKAVNHSTGTETAVKLLKIYIESPWYLSWWAKTVYLLIIICLGSAAWIRRNRRVKMRQEAVMKRMEQEHREKSYEEKLRFFTNITHEFCTPLTLIYGPCERILSYGDADDYVRKYATLIKNNTERLNSLIQEIIDFRRVETGNHKLNVKRINISELCREIVAAFDDLHDRLGVNLESNIASGVEWPTDYGCFTKIAYNLISNAFKYTRAGGTVRVNLAVENGKMKLSVYNTGKGIKPEDRELIFNRYSILDNVEENATRSLSSRNGLGMAICHSMTELLQGKIEIESEVGEYAMFIVSLPELEVTQNETVTQSESLPLNHLMPDMQKLMEDAEAVELEPEEDDEKGKAEKAGKHRILVIDDNVDILTLMRDSLSEYNVITAKSAEEGLEIMRKNEPELVITDIMMPGIDGIELTRLIKQDRHMSHIPLIILSARNSTDDRVAGLQSGAEVYVTKPFAFSYLRAVIARLLKGKSDMQEYFNSASAAVEYFNGKLVNRDDITFIDSMSEYVNANIENPELSPASMASHAQMSVRGLYRKMKELQLLPPNDFIKERRLAYATKLLVTTTLTIQEVMYRCGFTNRSHFYKEFDRRHGMTPKDYRKEHRVSDSMEDLDGGID